MKVIGIAEVILQNYLRNFLDFLEECLQKDFQRKFFELSRRNFPKFLAEVLQNFQRKFFLRNIFEIFERNSQNFSRKFIYISEGKI